jgi:diketogulonate reductase-like aldo/keto reductase
MAPIPTRTLPSGSELPVVGYGTYDLPDDGVGDAVRTALDAGYTHVDTAEGYGNEAAIGSVLEAYDREDVFLTSKVVPSNLHYEALLEALAASLDRLGTDYLDLYLVHWPNPAVSIRETMHAFERAHEEGFVRNVGVSNFSAYQLMFARKVSDVPIAVNQVEFHPWYYREDLLEYCRDHDVVVEAAAPLARTEFLDDPVLTDVAADHGVTPAQVALKWAVEKGVVVLPKSATPEHVRANLDLFDWELDEAALTRLDDVDRMESVYGIHVDHDVYGIPA